MEDELELQKVFQRDINCLLDESRVLRLNGLNSIVQGLFKSENKQEDIHELFKKALLKNLLKVVSDKVEKHRGISIQILTKFFDTVPNIDNDLVNSILKEAVLRLKDTPPAEPSEEIRLQLINLLMNIFKKGYHQAFIQNLSDIMFTLSKVLGDAFPDLKKETSVFVILLSEGIRENVGSHSLSVIKALAKNLAHQQSKVRRMTIESLGELLLTRDAGIHLREVLVNFKLAVNDKTSEVRKSSYLVIGRLLKQFSPSLLSEYEAELIQLLLNGLGDDNEEIINFAQELIEEAGQSIKVLDSEGMKDEHGNNLSE